jgi:hypothetical protein
MPNPGWLVAAVAAAEAHIAAMGTSRLPPADPDRPLGVTADVVSATLSTYHYVEPATPCAQGRIFGFFQGSPTLPIRYHNASICWEILRF